MLQPKGVAHATDVGIAAGIFLIGGADLWLQSVTADVKTFQVDEQFLVLSHPENAPRSSFVTLSGI